MFNAFRIIMIDVVVKNAAYKATRIVEIILPNRDNPLAIAFEKFSRTFPISAHLVLIFLY